MPRHDVRVWLAATATVPCGAPLPALQIPTFCVLRVCPEASFDWRSEGSHSTVRQGLGAGPIVRGQPITTKRSAEVSMGVPAACTFVLPVNTCTVPPCGQTRREASVSAAIYTT